VLVRSVAVKIFSLLIYFTKNFHKSYTFNAIFKGDAAIHCITVQHKEVHPRQRDGSYCASTCSKQPVLRTRVYSVLAVEPYRALELRDLYVQLHTVVTRWS
jgi:hypothetical protein